MYGDVDVIGNLSAPNLYDQTEIDTMLGYVSSYTPAVETVLNTTLEVPELKITNGLIMGNYQPIGAKHTLSALEDAIYLRDLSDNLNIISGNNAMVDIQQHATNGGASIARFMSSDKKDVFIRKC